MNLNPNGVTGFMITHIHILENFIPEAHLLPFNGNSAIFFDIETTGFTAGKNSIYLIGGGALEDIDERMNEYKEYNPAVETATVPNTKHLPHMEKPAEIYELIQTFLS